MKKITKQDVLSSYFRAVFKAILLIFCGRFFAILSNSYWQVGQEAINILGIIGAIFDAIALYGVFGQEIVSWSGESEEEKLNYRLASVCLSIGILCTVLSYSLKPIE
jgi:hypothetical protein